MTTTTQLTPDEAKSGIVRALEVREAAHAEFLAAVGRAVAYSDLAVEEVAVFAGMLPECVRREADQVEAAEGRTLRSVD